MQDRNAVETAETVDAAEAAVAADVATTAGTADVAKTAAIMGTADVAVAATTTEAACVAKTAKTTETAASPGSAAPSAGKAPAYDYTRFPRNFISYRWFKPFFVLGLGVAFVFLFQLLLVVVAIIWTGDTSFLDSIGTSYEAMDVFSGPGALLELGSLAVILPAIALAALIVRDRPYSSYSSSRGGWNWGLFGKCLLLALGVFVVDIIVESIIFPCEPLQIANRFTVVGVVFCTILGPLQCVAEEYLFRGFLMQTFGAWFRIPVLAIVLQAIVFALGHTYNTIGLIAVCFNGIMWGIIAWQTKGLEATSALHIVNNMMAFYATGLGLQAATSEIDITSAVVAAVIDVVYLALVLGLGKKRGWFEAKRDGAAAFNEKHRPKYERKQQLKAAKKARKLEQKELSRRAS